MKTIINRLKYNFQRFMYGRYGYDEFNRFLMYLFIGVFIFSLLFSRISSTLASLLNLLTWAIIFYQYYRMFSKNITKRYQENQRFINKKNYLVKRWNDRYTYRYFNCPTCKTHLRVPKGSGKVTIHCRKCDTRFDRKA